MVLMLMMKMLEVKIVKHVLYNNSYKACHNCHFSTKNERVEWTQTTPEE
jgi:hypothetical protein